MRLLLVGNYGVGNLGDELLREYFIRSFPDIEWAVLSATAKRPGELSRLPMGFRSLVCGSWRKTLKALRNSDGMVLGGGTLFTDTESVLACLLWYLHVRAAIFYRKKVYMAFQGIGPFHTRIGESCSRWVLRNAHYISVRDDASYMRTSAYKLNKEIIQSTDPVISLFIGKKAESSSKKVLILIPRHNSSGTFGELARQEMRKASYEEIRIVMLQPGLSSEQQFCDRLRISLSGYIRIVPALTADDLFYSLKDASLVLTERYHGAIAALCMGIPILTVSRDSDDKLSSLPRSSDLPVLLERLKRGEDSLRVAFD